MASTYSERLKLELQGTGENAGTWGDKTNNNLDVLDAFAAGYISKNVGGSANVTLTTANASATSEASNKVLDLNGTLTGNITVFIPAKENNYLVYNNTSGSYTLSVAATGHGANGVAITQGTFSYVYCDGASNYNVTNALSVFGAVTTKDDLTVTGNVNVSSNVNITDSSYINLGASDDLQIYHNGSHSFIDEVGTGNLYIRSNNLFLRSSANENFLQGTEDGAVQIYHDNTEKFTTTADGITVTGDVTADNIGNMASRNLFTTTSTATPDNGTGANGDFYIIHDA